MSKAAPKTCQANQCVPCAYTHTHTHICIAIDTDIHTARTITQTYKRPHVSSNKNIETHSMTSRIGKLEFLKNKHSPLHTTFILPYTHCKHTQNSVHFFTSCLRSIQTHTLSPVPVSCCAAVYARRRSQSGDRQGAGKSPAI